MMDNVELDNEDKISIIVAIYNIEKYLEECVKSIINQSYKNLQIILVDDGSTDSSKDICDKYAKIDNRIQVIHKKNGGLSDARNKGLEVAEGKYISFVDGDDYLFPTFYAVLHKLIKKYDADISECQFLRINETDMENSEKIIETHNKKIDIKEEVYDNLKALDLYYGARLAPYLKKVVVWNKLYTKEILDGITFPVGKLHEDEYTSYRILYKCKKIVSTNEILHGYIQTNNSIMRTEIKQKRVEDNLDAYEKGSEFFEKYGQVKLEMQCRRRYLENCIELAGKVQKSSNTNKQELINMIHELFLKNYERYIEQIKSNSTSNNENEIIEDIIIKAYNDLKNNNKCIGCYWPSLEEIVNRAL